MFIEINEKTRTNIDPSLRWAALLYSSQAPTIVRKPASVPQICTMEVNVGSVISCSGEDVSRNAPSMVTSPAIIEAANAAVGFGCVLVANSYLTYGMRAKSIKRLLPGQGLTRLGKQNKPLLRLLC